MTLEGGLAEVTKVMYVKSQGLAVATRELINDQPEWAFELARAGLALKGKGPKPGVGTARPALQVAAPEEEPAAATATAAAETAGGPAMDADDEAELAAATAALGGAKR